VPKYQVERRRFGLGASWTWRGDFHWITALPVRSRRGPFGRSTGEATHPVKRRSRQDLEKGDGSRRAQRLRDGAGTLRDDRQQNPRRAFGLPMALFPVLNRIQREAKSRGELRLT